MSTEEVVTVGHQEGPPWKTVGRFPTFDEADQKRLELSNGRKSSSEGALDASA